MFLYVSIPTVLILGALTAFVLIRPAASAVIITVAADLLTLYFLISPLFGYVELREQTVYIKFGFLTSREIEYARIRSVNTERKWYSESMLSLKCAYEHVNIKYNSFDVTTVSVRDNEYFAAELDRRRNGKTEKE
jgi:hypothetical protein